MVTKTSETSHESPSVTSTSLHGLVIILLLLSLVGNVITISLLTGFSFPFGYGKKSDTLGIRQALLDLEYQKVGGKENYEILQKYSLQQIQGGIAQIKAAVEGGGDTAAVTGQPVANADAFKMMSVDEAKSLLASGYVEGNKDAGIAVIEYSEMECPFCAQQYHDTKLREKLTAEYGDKISFTYKNNK
jgi:hypothetical protein